MGWWRDLTGGFGPVGKTLIGLLVVVGVVVVLPIALILGVIIAIGWVVIAMAIFD